MTVTSSLPQVTLDERNPFGGLPRHTSVPRNDIIVQRAFYNGASAEILSASLGILAYARGVRRKYSGSAEDVI